MLKSAIKSVSHMPLILIIFSIFTLIPVKSPAGDKIPLSLSVGSGIVIPRGEFKPYYDAGPLFSAGMGMEFGPAVTLELQTRLSSTKEPFAVPDYTSYEYPFGNDSTSNDHQTSNRINLFGFLAKVRAFPLYNVFDGALEPYLCFSAGIAFADQTNPALDTSFAYNNPAFIYEYGGGIKYRLSPKMSILADISWTSSKFKYEYIGDGYLLFDPYGNPRPFDQLSISAYLNIRL